MYLINIKSALFVDTDIGSALDNLLLTAGHIKDRCGECPVPKMVQSLVDISKRRGEKNGN
jgi:hypothetical protein